MFACSLFATRKLRLAIFRKAIQNFPHVCQPRVNAKLLPKDLNLLQKRHRAKVAKGLLDNRQRS